MALANYWSPGINVFAPIGNELLRRTFNILSTTTFSKGGALGFPRKNLTAVSPNSFMITAILYPCFSVKIRLCVSQQAGLCTVDYRDALEQS
jgi:hypothetical protein